MQSPKEGGGYWCLNQSQLVQKAAACFGCQVECPAHHLSGCCALSPLLCLGYIKLLGIFSVPFFYLLMTWDSDSLRFYRHYGVRDSLLFFHFLCYLIFYGRLDPMLMWGLLTLSSLFINTSWTQTNPFTFLTILASFLQDRYWCSITTTTTIIWKQDNISVIHNFFIMLLHSGCVWLIYNIVFIYL
jgi:hypothetical protein